MSENTKVVLLIPKIKGGFNSEKVKDAISCEIGVIPAPISMDGTHYSLNQESSFMVNDSSSGEGFSEAVSKFLQQPQAIETVLITQLRTYKDQDGKEMMYPVAELALFWNKLMVESEGDGNYTFRFFPDTNITDPKQIPGLRYVTYKVDKGVAQKNLPLYVNLKNNTQEKIAALKVWNEKEPKSIA